MQVNITSAPDYAMAEVGLAASEQVVVEAGSMVAMSSNIQIETKAKGGILSGLKRMVGGESFFIKTYTAAGAPGHVFIAPGPPGDVIKRSCSGKSRTSSSAILPRTCVMPAAG